MNILLLAAGQGKRFQDHGFPPKPLIDINGKPMWERVLEDTIHKNNFPPGFEYTSIVATKEEYNIESDTHAIIELSGPQYGAAYSAVEALDDYFFDSINSEDYWKFLKEPLLILNCDQLVELDGSAFLNHIYISNPDGCLLHFMEPNKEWKWGRSILDEYDPKSTNVVKIVEKEPVSDYAHTGIYYFKHTGEFIHYAEKMIRNDIKINGEYFLSPVYNLMIEDELLVTPFFVDRFIPLGVPEELERYLNG